MMFFIFFLFIFFIFFLSLSMFCVFFFFFFQAEDGIRDLYVTGVQTCALPIFEHSGRRSHRRGWNDKRRCQCSESYYPLHCVLNAELRFSPSCRDDLLPVARSEERRVGKECRSGWWPAD